MLIRTLINLANQDKNSLRKLSKDLKCSHSWLSQVISGKRDPNINLLREVHKLTGKSYDVLMQSHPYIEEETKVNLDLLIELFNRRKTSVPYRHIKPLAKRPSKIEQDVIDNIKQTTDFDFNQITLNYNYQMKPHKHKNTSSSLAMLLGDFDGGALCLENGEEHITKDVWFHFDGRLNHWVKPFTGNRFSIILYKR